MLMEETNFNKLKAEVAKAMGKAHLGGIKGEVLHEHLRGAITRMHFKWIERGEMRIEDVLKELDENIKEHLVVKSEKAEHKAVHLIVKDFVQLYFTMHSLLLFEKNDLEEFQKFIKEFRKFATARGLAKDVVNKTVALLKDVAKVWKDEIEEFRKMVNSVWARAKGDKGWSLTAFERMHKEGYFVRYQERKMFRQTLKDEKKVEALVDKVHKIKSAEELDKVLAAVHEDEIEIVRDFQRIEQFLFNTWDHVLGEMNRFVKIVADAAGIHELPATDSDQMRELHVMIADRLNEQYLHALRIDDKQVEAIYEDAVHDIE
jgi:hypothetical protein